MFCLIILINHLPHSLEWSAIGQGSLLVWFAAVPSPRATVPGSDLVLGRGSWNEGGGPRN